MPVPAVYSHVNAAKFDVDIRAWRELTYGLLPRGEHFFLPGGVWLDAKRAAQMVEHDSGAGKRFGEIGDFAELRMKCPHIKA